MEKQRILFVILSVSLLLIVVLAGSLYFFRPRADSERAAEDSVTSLSKVDFDPFEYVKGTQEPPELEPAAKAQQVELQQYEIVIGERDSQEQDLVPPLKVEETQNVLADRKAEYKVESYTPVPTPKPSSKPTVQEYTVREFWIQAASYKSRTRAQYLIETLAAEGITARITTKTVQGKSFYRVRIGPYTSEQEAKKFLMWVQGISELENSYISVVYAKRIAQQ